MRTSKFLRSMRRRFLNVGVAALFLLANAPALAQPQAPAQPRASAQVGDLTANDVDAGIAGIEKLAAFFESSNAAPIDGRGNSPALPLSRAYREIADRLLLKRQRGEIAIGENNLPPLVHSAAKPRKPTSFIKLQLTLSGAWQGAGGAATRRTQREVWGYDGAVARALLKALAREQPKTMMPWHARQLARAGMTSSRSALAPTTMIALSTYWLTRDRYLWAANLARLETDLLVRYEWKNREAVALFEMMDVLADVERDLGKAWRPKLSEDWNGFRRGVESAASNPAAMARAAGFLPESPVAPKFSPQDPYSESAVSEWAARERVARERVDGEFVAPKPVKLPSAQETSLLDTGLKAGPSETANVPRFWAWLLALAALSGLALLARRRKTRRPLPETIIDVAATVSPPPDPLPTEQGRSPSPPADHGQKADDPTVTGERHKAAALAQILTDIDPTLRRQWSSELCRKADAPRYLVRSLACDDIAIALPLLTLSPVLTTQDLQAIGVTTSEQHRLAIAMRPGLEGAVVESLLAFEEPQVLLALLQNSTIELDPVLMSAFVALTAQEPVLNESLLARPEFDADLARRIYWQATSAMRALIISRFGRGVAIAGPDAADAFGGTGAGNSVPIGAAIIASPETLSGAITPELMVEVLQANNLELFKNLFGQLCGLPKTEVEKILLSPSGEEFAVACRALGIDTLPFSRMFLLYRRLSEGSESFDRANEHGAFPRALQVFETTTAESARAILERWRQAKAVDSPPKSSPPIVFPGAVDGDLSNLNF
jgi:uncharacterized protein (DUF2336 family)